MKKLIVGLSVSICVLCGCSVLGGTDPTSGTKPAPKPNVPDRGWLDCGDKDVNPVCKNSSRIYDSLWDIHDRFDRINGRLRALLKAKGAVEGLSDDSDADAVLDAGEKCADAVKPMLSDEDRKTLKDDFNLVPAVAADLKKAVQGAKDLIPSISNLIAQASSKTSNMTGLAATSAAKGSTPISALNLAKDQMTFVSSGELVTKISNSVDRFSKLLGALVQ